jgi:hypothetical protein
LGFFSTIVVMFLFLVPVLSLVPGLPRQPMENMWGYSALV